ncbi:hypothetical protein JHK82_044925 [Glycine max]|nr:hypothetical protein JHK82_044925 [Glycine max]
MPMLMALFLLWNRNLHAPELPYGPIRLTLLDIVVITGLKPLGKTYALGLFKDQIKRNEIDIDFNVNSYGSFIEKKVKDTEESTTSKPSKTNVLKGLDDSNEDAPISSSFKTTFVTTTKQKSHKPANVATYAKLLPLAYLATTNTSNASATTTIAPTGTAALLCQLDRGSKDPSSKAHHIGFSA